MESHYKITGQDLIPVKIWRNSDARVLLAPFLPFSKFWLFNTCYSSAISGLIHGLLYLYSLQIWTFTNWNNFGRYRCCNQSLVTFANFAKFVDCWRAFFHFVLLKYERLENLLFLVLIRCLLSLFLWLQWQFLLLLRCLRHLRTFQGPSSPFFFPSLEFGYVCYSCYSCHICYSVLLDSGFLEALLGLFPSNYILYTFFYCNVFIVMSFYCNVFRNSAYGCKVLRQ